MPYLENIVTQIIYFANAKYIYLPLKGKFDANQNWTDWKYRALEHMEG